MSTENIKDVEFVEVGETEKKESKVMAFVKDTGKKAWAHRKMIAGIAVGSAMVVAGCKYGTKLFATSDACEIIDATTDEGVAEFLNAVNEAVE